jgi:hypothetical protein
MGIMEYADASEFHGPRPLKDHNTIQALQKLIDEACDLFFVIDHPRYKGVYAEVDPHIKMQIYPGVLLESFGFILLEGDELLVLQQKTAHWHKHHTKTRLVKSADEGERKRLVERFKARVSLLMGNTPPRPKRNKNME